MKAEHSHKTDELLVKYLLGEASEAEQQQVKQWIGESDENNRHFYHFKLLWDESANLAAVSTVDEDAGWAKFKQRTQAASKKTIPLPTPFRWLKVAAVFLLLAGSSWLGYYFMSQNNDPGTVTKKALANPVNKPFDAKSKDPDAAQPSLTEANEQPRENPAKNESAVTTKPAQAVIDGTTTIEHPRKVASDRKIAATDKKQQFIKEQLLEPHRSNFNHTREFICNETHSPLEICIIQSVKCQDGVPLATSTCSVLEPDESGQLRYKAFDKITKNCNATIQEIRIKQVNTGETYVLNANSKPSTAEDFFNYITGNNKTDMFAGVFEADCNDNNDDCELRFDNGRLIMH